MQEKFLGKIVKIQTKRPTLFIRLSSVAGEFNHLERVKVTFPIGQKKERREVEGVILSRFVEDNGGVFQKKTDILIPSPTGEKFEYEDGETIELSLSKPAFPEGPPNIENSFSSKE